MRNQLKTFYSALLIVATLGLTSTVHGIPAFARQTGLECSSCHASAGFPVLNAFGQAFKAGGYSQANEDDLIGDGETLSLPRTLNASIVLKVRNPIGNTKDLNNVGGGTDADVVSKLELPDETGLIFGGRIAKDMGFMLEFALPDAEIANAKFMYMPEVGPVRLGVSGWASSDGPGMMFENLSTGQIANIRPAERLKGAAHSVDMHIGTKGIGIVVWHPMGFLVATPVFDASNTVWSNSNDTAIGQDNVGYYIRVAATPTFGNVSMGIGASYLGGTITAVDATTSARTKNELGTFTVDAQAFMDVGLPLSIFGSFGMDTSADTASGGNELAAQLYVEAGVVPDVFNIGPFVGFTNKAETKVDTISFGAVAKYYMFKNVKLELDFTYTTISTDGTSNEVDEWEIMPLVFAAF
jgi:hypothetical protein